MKGFPDMLYYFDSLEEQTIPNMSNQLLQLMYKDASPEQPLVIMCIGSDRSTGDSLGPIIGYKLQKFNFNNVYIYGSLKQPIHAANLQDAIDMVMATYNDPYIIAIDASLGKREHIGYITLGTGPLKPGLGVKKKLPEVGNIHITGIVNSSGMMDNVLLQTTRLSTIMTLADIITAVFINVLDTYKDVNVYPYKLQEPDLLLSQLMTS
jgi:putative sporulation protein YyaC